MSKKKSSKYMIAICVIAIVISMYFSIKSAIYLYTPAEPGDNVATTTINN